MSNDPKSFSVMIDRKIYREAKRDPDNGINAQLRNALDDLVGRRAPAPLARQRVQITLSSKQTQALDDLRERLSVEHGALVSRDFAVAMLLKGDSK